MLFLVFVCLGAGAGETPDRVVAIVGGDVFTGAGEVIRGGTVIIRNGVIEAVGRGVTVPEGAETHDASGMRVLPGFVAASAVQVATAPGYDNRGNLSDGLDPFALGVELAVASGITTVYTEAGMVGFWGREPRTGEEPSAVIRMTWGELDGMTLAEPGALDMTSWLRATPSQHWDIRRRFQRAREVLDRRADWQRRREANTLQPNEQEPPIPDDLKSHAAALQWRRPVRVEAHTRDEILRALRLTEEFPVRLVLIGAEEGWTVADEIGRAGAACIVTARARIDEREETARESGSRPENAAILHEAGVRIAIVPPNDSLATGGMGGRDLMTLPIEAAFAIRGGLDEAAALEAITSGAAEILGVGDRVGTIAVGREGDIILLDGDPFDHRTFVQRTFVRGRLVYDKDQSPFFRHIRPDGR